MTLRLELTGEVDDEGLEVAAVLTGPRAGDAKGEIVFSRHDGNEIRPLRGRYEFEIHAFEETRVTKRIGRRDGVLPSAVHASAKLTASEEPVTLRAQLKIAQDER